MKQELTKQDARFILGNSYYQIPLQELAKDADLVRDYPIEGDAYDCFEAKFNKHGFEGMIFMIKATVNMKRSHYSDFRTHENTPFGGWQLVKDPLTEKIFANAGPRDQ